MYAWNSQEIAIIFCALESWKVFKKLYLAFLIYVFRKYSIKTLLWFIQNTHFFAHQNYSKDTEETKKQEKKWNCFIRYCTSVNSTIFIFLNVGAFSLVQEFKQPTQTTNHPSSSFFYHLNCCYACFLAFVWVIAR